MAVRTVRLWRRGVLYKAAGAGFRQRRLCYHPQFRPEIRGDGPPAQDKVWKPGQIQRQVRLRARNYFSRIAALPVPPRRRRKARPGLRFLLYRVLSAIFGAVLLTGLFLKRVKFRLYVLAGEDHWLIPRNRHMIDTVQQGFPFSGAGVVSQISLHNYSSFLSVYGLPHRRWLRGR